MSRLLFFFFLTFWVFLFIFFFAVYFILCAITAKLSRFMIYTKGGKLEFCPPNSLNTLQVQRTRTQNTM